MEADDNDDVLLDLKQANLLSDEDEDAIVNSDLEDEQDPLVVEQYADEEEDMSTQRFLSHTDSVLCVDVKDKDNSHLAVSGGCDDKAYLWDYSTGETLFELTGHSESVSAVGFNFDGTYVATATMDGICNIFRTDDGTLLQTLNGLTEEVTSICWHPRGNVVIASSSDSTVHMWNAVSGQCMQVFSGHRSSVRTCRFTPDGKSAVTVSEDCTSIIWDPKTAQLKEHIQGRQYHNSPINCLDIHSSSPLMVTGDESGVCMLQSIAGKVVGSFHEHKDSVEAVGLCNEMPWALSASLDGSVVIWDIGAQQQRSRFEHTGGVIKAMWHTTNVYSASLDGTVRVFDSRSSRCVRLFTGHADQLLDFTVSSDGKSIITAAEDHACLVFQL